MIYFNPSDTERPMGLNLLEAETPEERDLVAMDAMNLMIKMFDEEIFGPRIQDYFRNGCLTLMEYENGGALTDIVRLFTDDAFQKVRREQVTNPIVKSFWDNQMAKTSAEEQQRIIPYFAAKFAAFITNTMMRNIIGQTKSGFDFGSVMNDGKILFMNLSKGLVGDFNSQLLGLIIVSKLQMAALRRQKLDPSQRKDFFLYIDEFQNYITDSIESILSEARKYRLSLNLAHQYIGQLVQKNDEKIKNAVFILHCSASGYSPYINLLNHTLIKTQQAPSPVQSSLEFPKKFASKTNQFNSGGIDLMIIKTVKRVKKALKLLEFIFLFKISKDLTPLNSILIK